LPTIFPLLKSWKKEGKMEHFLVGFWPQMPNVVKTGENLGKIREKIGEKMKKRRKNEGIEWKKIGHTFQRLYKIVVMLIDWV
jgi:hypothetical protein